jgi:putative SOS response-associated peptidase YedK
MNSSAQIHPRMLVILPEKHHAAWLGETDDGNLKELLVPYPADQMRMWAVHGRAPGAKVVPRLREYELVGHY